MLLRIAGTNQGLLRTCKAFPRHIFRLRWPRKPGSIEDSHAEAAERAQVCFGLLLTHFFQAQLLRWEAESRRAHILPSSSNAQV